MISHLYRCSVIHINCDVTSFFFLFSLFRQASLNEAAERQYERAAGLRPDVSTWAGGPVSTYHGNAHTRPYCKFNLQHTKCYPSFWHYVIVLLFLANSYTAEYKNGKIVSCPWLGTRRFRCAYANTKIPQREELGGYCLLIEFTHTARWSQLNRPSLVGCNVSRCQHMRLRKLRAVISCFSIAWIGRFKGERQRGLIQGRQLGVTGAHAFLDET